MTKQPESLKKRYQEELSEALSVIGAVYIYSMNQPSMNQHLMSMGRKSIKHKHSPEQGYWEWGDLFSKHLMVPMELKQVWKSCVGTLSCRPTTCRRSYTGLVLYKSGSGLGVGQSDFSMLKLALGTWNVASCLYGVWACTKGRKYWVDIVALTAMRRNPGPELNLLQTIKTLGCVYT